MFFLKILVLFFLFFLNFYTAQTTINFTTSVFGATSYSEDGYTLNADGPGISTSATCTIPSYSWNGQLGLLQRIGATQAILTKNDGRVFTPLSFDITLGQTSVYTFTTNFGAVFTSSASVGTYSFPATAGWVNITSLTISAIPDNCGIITLLDNIVLDGVTAPTISTSSSHSRSNCSFPFTIDPFLLVVDVDEDLLTATITSTSAGDSLSATNLGPLSPAAMQAALRSVTFNNFSGTLGLRTITFNISDGNESAFDTVPITITNSAPIFITCPSNIITTNTAGQCGRVVTYVSPIGGDECPGAVITLTSGLPSGAFFPVGTTLVTYTNTDAVGSSSFCSFTVTVNDTQAPSITCPSNITVPNTAGQCGAVVNYTPPVGTDNCPGATTTRTGGLPSGAFFPVGSTLVTYTVTDAVGNSTPCSFTVTVNDTQAPSITCPSNITVSNTVGQCGAVVNYTPPVGTDNCPGATTNQTGGLPSGAFFPVGSTLVTYTVIDFVGNSTPCSFTVTVNDTQAPSITCPSNITVSNTVGQCGAVVNYTPPVGTDNCPGATTNQTGGLASGAFFPVGSTPVTYTVTDAVGNSTPCSFTVTVNDTEAPSISCPANITQTADSGVCNAFVVVPAPLTSDNCPGAVVVNSFNGSADASDTYPVGLTTVLCTLTDASGNQDTCSFTVTVTDNEAPIAIAQDVTLSLDPTGNLSITGADVDNGSSDNCGIASLTVSPSTFTCANTGANIVTLTVTDIYGNVSTALAMVTLEDTVLPLVVCAPDVSQNNPVVFITPPTVSDECGVSTVINDYNSTASASDVYPIGTTSVLWTVTDSSGNQDTCSQLISVVPAPGTDPNPLPVVITYSGTNQGAVGWVLHDTGICGAITDYYIYVGSKPGKYDYIRTGFLTPASLGGSTSFAYDLSPLPTNGTTVWLRLWYRSVGCNRVWKWIDTSFTSEDLSPPPNPALPAIITPVPPASLSGSSVAMTWFPGMATTFYLYVGSGLGQSNYYKSPPLVGTTHTILNLPANNSTVYVRFWYRLGNVWSFTDLTYTSAP